MSALPEDLYRLILEQCSPWTSYCMALSSRFLLQTYADSYCDNDLLLPKSRQSLQPVLLNEATDVLQCPCYQDLMHDAFHTSANRTHVMQAVDVPGDVMPWDGSWQTEASVLEQDQTQHTWQGEAGQSQPSGDMCIHSAHVTCISQQRSPNDWRSDTRVYSIKSKDVARKIRLLDDYWQIKLPNIIPYRSFIGDVVDFIDDEEVHVTLIGDRQRQTFLQNPFPRGKHYELDSWLSLTWNMTMKDNMFSLHPCPRGHSPALRSEQTDTPSYTNTPTVTAPAPGKSLFGKIVAKLRSVI